MNSCILMVKIISDPELRHVQQDGGEPIAVTSVLVEFETLQSDRPTSTLKVVGWRDLAEKMKQDYSQGDRVIVQGRLAMNVIQIQGVKEKKAELVASRIYPVSENKDADFDDQERSLPTSTGNNVVYIDSYESTSSRQSEATTKPIDPIPQGNSNSTEENLDDIPFMRSVSLKTSDLDIVDHWEWAANLPGCWLQGTRDIWL